MSLHLDSLPHEQRRLWEAFAEADMSDMVLYTEGSPASTLKALCWFKGGNLERLSNTDKEFLKETVVGVRSLPPPARGKLTLKNVFASQTE